MSDNGQTNFLIAGGGTGGHLFPAMAVGQSLEQLLGGKAKLIFAGSRERMESEIVPRAGYEFHGMDISGLTKLLSLNTLQLPFKIFNAMRQCRKIIRDNNIKAVIVTGAYISYPPGLAAYKENVPLFLLESNVNPGKTIKMLSPKAKAILTSFDESAEFFPNEVRQKIHPFGNPVRSNIGNSADRQAALKQFGFNDKKPLLLVFGGSLGAASINSEIEKLISQISELNINMLWQTGKNYIPSVDIPDFIRQTTFIDDMAAAYAAADMVISRSGATTVAELCLAGKPSILIPYPGAANNEQENNAKVLSERGASILIRDNELSVKLQGAITKTMKDQVLRNDMAAIAKSISKPNASVDCANFILNSI